MASTKLLHKLEVDYNKIFIQCRHVHDTAAVLLTKSLKKCNKHKSYHAFIEETTPYIGLGR